MMKAMMTMMIRIMTTSDGTAMSNAPRLPKEHVTFRKIARFRSFVLQVTSVDEIEYGTLVERHR
jgi:hypothetical protein